MTELSDRLTAMLDGEPTAPYDLDRVVAAGRRSLRRRNTLTAVAGTAGTAAVTAAIVVPISFSNNRAGAPDRVVVGAQPPASPKPAAEKCTLVREERMTSKERRTDTVGGSRIYLPLREIRAKHPAWTGTLKFEFKHGAIEFLRCPGWATPADAAQPTSSPAPTLPPYHYAADPQGISTALGDELAAQVKALGFSVVYTAPFSQESSTLEKGHPTYFGGNVDVQLPDGPADIGVQVTHAVTELVPFDGACNAPDCTQTTLPDGSVEQVSHIKSGSGGAMVIAVEIHHPDGLVVQAQEANYAFGPEATKARSSQPLSIDQLTSLAEDPAFTF